MLTKKNLKKNTGNVGCIYTHGQTGQGWVLARLTSHEMCGKTKVTGHVIIKTRVFRYRGSRTCLRYQQRHVSDVTDERFIHQEGGLTVS